ncbi:DNA polymerase III subunit gamma/tau [Campylobacter concisus]|uniref:DNA polymerase III subunit gamma/tau n=1 Tax=Campylobacter concisus ATCC 51562 TaxID=1242969 RepID=U2GEA4_9BACT|nr:DNA polymerase III subunit gamma/tau [Campylobacter concisus]ERJ26409.1 DNA polymerase III subunits gamma and tau [Campylobacter concisus ATCC 51562]
MQALALKYRPKNFDELIGQEAVSKSLIHALDEGRISHAYLFSGLRGSGKTSSARIFSKALVCEKGPTSKPCEVCPQCIMANESRHMDIIEMDAASHRKIDDIRELIEQTKYAPAMARYKIFIIDEVHMLTKEAFNALLKTLEEPPSYVKFILATTDPLKLPTTVLSRTQHFRFKQISRYSIIKHLEFILSKEGISYEKEALEILARSGGGSLRDTLTLLDQAIIYGANNVTANGVASMLGLLDPEKIEEIITHVLNHDKNAIRVLVSELESYDPEMIIDEILANLKQKFIENDSKISLLVYERFFRILAQAKGMLNVSSDNGFVLMLMLFMMIEALNLQDIDDAINEVISKNSENSTQITEVITQKSQAAPTKMQGPYELFLTKIYDRNYDLGEFFKEFVEFSFFNNNEFGLIVNAKDENLEYFKKNWKILNEILRTLFGQNAKIVNAKSDEQKVQTKTPKASLENNEKSELDELDEEILRLNANNIETKNESKIEIKSELQNEKNNFALMLNKEPKTPEELQRQREQGVLKEANRLFGEPTIES